MSDTGGDTKPFTHKGTAPPKWDVRVHETAYGVTRISLTDADAAFIIGRNGRTKEKIARVSGAQLGLPHGSLTLRIEGTPEQRRKAVKYCQYVMAQRVGPVYIDDDGGDDDLTFVQVPQECTAFVTGSGGSFLRHVEDECGAIMFFVGYYGKGRKDTEPFQQLAIFGPARSRKGAEFKVLSAIESKLPGYCTDGLEDHESDEEGLAVDTLRLPMKEISWALGKNGATKRKLARASECVIEYVGNVVFMCGSKRQRRTAKDYLRWIMQRLEGPVVPNLAGRDDVTIIAVPQDTVGYVTGAKRGTLSKIEDDWGVFMLSLGDKNDGKRETEQLVIFGPRRARRGAELKILSTTEEKHPGSVTKDLKEGISKEEWGTDVYLFKEGEKSYALGKEGSARRNLSAASGCIIEYVGPYALFSGSREERRRGRKYLDWLLRQWAGTIRMEDINLDEHPDVARMHMPQDTLSEIVGVRGSGLRAVQSETGAFLLMLRDKAGNGHLLICAADPLNRRKAESLIQGLVDDRSYGGKYGYSDWGPPSRSTWNPDYQWEDSGYRGRADDDDMWERDGKGRGRGSADERHRSRHYEQWYQEFGQTLPQSRKGRDHPPVDEDYDRAAFEQQHKIMGPVPYALIGKGKGKSRKGWAEWSGVAVANWDGKGYKSGRDRDMKGGKGEFMEMKGGKGEFMDMKGGKGEPMDRVKGGYGKGDSMERGKGNPLENGKGKGAEQWQEPVRRGEWEDAEDEDTEEGYEDDEQDARWDQRRRRAMERTTEKKERVVDDDFYESGKGYDRDYGHSGYADRYYGRGVRDPYSDNFDRHRDYPPSYERRGYEKEYGRDYDDYDSDYDYRREQRDYDRDYDRDHDLEYSRKGEGRKGERDRDVKRPEEKGKGRKGQEQWSGKIDR